MKNIIDLSGKTVLVTGASGGIGRAVCLGAAAVGAKVILVARNEQRLSETLAAMEGTGHKIYTYDMCDFAGMEAFIEKVVAENAPLDGFAHCAGIAPSRPFATCTYERMLEVMNTNFFSFAELCRCLCKKQNHRAPFSIVGVSSVSASTAAPAKIPYGASKAAMDALTRSLAKEYAPKNIRVNTVVPGVIDTPMSAYLRDNAEYNASLAKRQFLGWGEPEDVADMILYLLSDAGKFISGAQIAVDGGYSV